MDSSVDYPWRHKLSRILTNTWRYRFYGLVIFLNVGVCYLGLGVPLPGAPALRNGFFVDECRVDEHGRLWLLEAHLCGAYALSSRGGIVPVAAPPTQSPPVFNLVKDRRGNTYYVSGNTLFRRDAAGAASVVAGNDRLPAPRPPDAGYWTRQLSIAVDPEGNLYCAVSAAHAVYRVSDEGHFTRVAGTGDPGYGGDGGRATDARLTTPCGIALDASGNLYIADAGNHRVRRVDRQGIIATVAGNGSRGLHGDGGPALLSGLETPLSVLCDGAGNLYINEAAHTRVRRVDRNGTIRTVARSRSCCGYPVYALLAWKPGSRGPGSIYVVDGDRVSVATRSGMLRLLVAHSLFSRHHICCGGLGN